MVTSARSPVEVETDRDTVAVQDWDEPTLVARAQDGDLDAFQALVEQYQGPLFRLAVRMVHDRGLAEDLVQDTFLTCWRKLPTLGDPVAFRAWIYQIASRRSLDMIRRRQVRSEVPEPTSAEETWDGGAAQGSDDPGRAAVRNAQLAALNTELAALPPELRLCWVMREIHHLSYDEISTAVRAPVSTVRGRLARARMTLAERMESWR